MVHNKVPSRGEMVSSKSLPYKQRPASNLKLSRAPKPASLTSPFFNNFSARATASEWGTEIYKI
jgi:hypothetical protein